MNLGQQILTGGSKTPDKEEWPRPTVVAGPNRAQRRAAAQERTRKQRRGQRAYNRMQREE